MEYRPQQSDMAIHVIQSMIADSPLAFEAGTGVGKSLAYLIPGILKAVSSERKLIVSSHTISLQEQILKKDLETCRTLFRAVPELKDYSVFKSCLLIGKGNYLCTTRLKKALKDKADLFETKHTEELARIEQWAKETETGIIQELYPQPPMEVWDWVNADSTRCNRRNCSDDSCFYQKAKAQIEKSDVVILNHALMFSLVGAGMNPGRDTRGYCLQTILWFLTRRTRFQTLRPIILDSPQLKLDCKGSYLSSTT
jgi:ATP-dependent DNA helicase DinG